MSQTLNSHRMRADVADVLGIHPDEIAADDNLIDLGLDSIRLMSLVERWSAAGVAVDFAELAEHPTLDHWATVISVRMRPDAATS